MHARLVRLFQHQAWADREILSALDDADERLAPAIRLFGHVVAAEFIWLGRISGRPPEGFVPWQELSLGESRDLAESNARRFLELVEGLVDERLGGIVEYRTTKGDLMATPLGDILLHVALHGSYHRGQIAAKLAALEIPVPATDFVVFSRMVPSGASSP